MAYGQVRQGGGSGNHYARSIRVPRHRFVPRCPGHPPWDHGACLPGLTHRGEEPCPSCDLWPDISGPLAPSALYSRREGWDEAPASSHLSADWVRALIWGSGLWGPVGRWRLAPPSSPQASRRGRPRAKLLPRPGAPLAALYNPAGGPSRRLARLDYQCRRVVLCGWCRGP